MFDEAARLDKAVEIDCFPDRQDLDQETLETARQSGVRISLGSDAHGFTQFAHLDLGLAAAWKAGISPERLVSFMTVEELLNWTAGLRERSRAR